MSEVDKDIAALEHRLQTLRHRRYVHWQALGFWLSLWTGISASIIGNNIPIGPVWSTVLAGPLAIALVFLAMIFLVRLLMVFVEWYNSAD